MEKKTITIEQEKVQDLYNILTNYPAISKEQVIMEMNKCFGEKTFKPIDITERIKTFEDACNELGETHPLVVQYKEIFGNFLNGANPSNSVDILAYLKLRIVVAALNEGWEPEFTQGEERWVPCFVLLTEKERTNNSEELKQERGLRTTEDYKGVWAGLAYDYSCSSPSFSDASIGFRLCFKTHTLAEYAGTQFIDLWMPFCLIHK